METRVLGCSDLKITRIGFGAWAAGGPWEFGWSAQDDNESVGAIHRALELGINWIDTAAIYGLGHSEKVVGQAVKFWSGQRPYIFTKCGMLWDDRGNVSYSTKAASIRREVEASLQRLNVEVIDLYQMHWPADDLAETEEGWAEMARLKTEGKVRWIGASNFSVDELRRAQAIAPVVSIQPPYSLIKPEAQAELLPFCGAQNIGAIVYSPMGSGLLSGSFTRERVEQLPADDWRRKSADFKEPKLSANLQCVERLRKIAEKYKCSPGEVAIAWTLRNPAVTAAIVGARNAKQVEGFYQAGALRLSDEESAFLKGETAKP